MRRAGDDQPARRWCPRIRRSLYSSRDADALTHTCGGAEYVRPKRGDDYEQLDALHADLGAFLDEPEPELEGGPAVVTVPPGAVVKIDRLAAMLERKADSIRSWIEHGIIPPAPIRLAGNVRAWPAAEAAAIVAAARREHILSKPRRPIGESNFSILC